MRKRKCYPSQQASLSLLNRPLVKTQFSARADWMSSNGSTTERSKATSKTSRATSFIGMDEPELMEASDTVARRSCTAYEETSAQRSLGDIYLKQKRIAPFYWKLRTNIQRRRIEDQLRMNRTRMNSFWRKRKQL